MDTDKITFLLDLGVTTSLIVCDVRLWKGQGEEMSKVKWRDNRHDDGYSIWYFSFMILDISAKVFGAACP